jgi:hypothetical protein
MAEVEPGQFWRLWVHDDSYRETLLVERVEGARAFGVTLNGSAFGVGVARLESDGERIDPPRFYGRELKP